MPISIIYSLYITVCASVLVYVYRNPRSKKILLPLPPGPPTDPLIGHLRLIPLTDHHLFFHELSKSYGDVVHLDVLGRSMIVLNSTEAAEDLMETRSANYSDRPFFRVLQHMGWTHALSILGYGKRFQLHRRIFQQHFNKTTAAGYRPFQIAEARILAQTLSEDPEDKEGVLTRFSTAVIMQIAYGHRVTSIEDRYVKLAEEVGAAVALTGSAGGTLVDFFPILQYLPSWFPGTYYLNFAREWAPKVQQMHDLPVQAVQAQLEEGIAKQSIVGSQLDALLHNEAGAHKIEDIKGTATMIYFAGAETTSSALSVFLLAMVLYPEYQAAAQAEIDAVIGSQRLPEFDDRETLPLLNCIVQETLRWHTPLPTGIPHRAMEDDVYNGMFIPGGSITISNIRSMTWDESVYKNATTFDPTRYLPRPSGRSEPISAAPWGFGRRKCPGRHLADNSLWIAIATILSTLQISKALNKDGQEMEPKIAFVTAITSRPLPFKYRATVRSEAAKSLLAQVDTSFDH